MATEKSYIQQAGFHTLWMPTLTMAAKALGLSRGVLKAIFKRTGVNLYQGERLTFEALWLLIELYLFSARKYLEKCIAEQDKLTDEEQLTFSFFKHKYGKTFHIVRHWGDINEEKLAREFYDDLFTQATNTLLYQYTIQVEKYLQEKDAGFDCWMFNGYKLSPFKIIREDLYNSSREETRILTRPLHASIVATFMLSNRFHIFSDDSDATHITSILS